LREWVAGRLRARGVDVTADDVIITSGAQQAVAIAAELVGRPGQRIGVDPESYPAALELFRSQGLLPTRDASQATAFYVMPAVSNPRGRALPADERAALLASDAPVIEDDAYAELAFDGALPKPLIAAARERVFYVGTLSKTLCPGLRVGWLVPPRRDRERALRAKQVRDLQANGLGQALAEEYLAHTDFEARLGKLRRFYAERAERLLAALRRHFPEAQVDEPRGGFSLWVELGEDGDDADLLARAIQAGVSFDPGREFRPNEESSPVAFRLAFSYANTSDFDVGVRRLAETWRRYSRERRAHAAA
jgi:2-aminoadipate transaminase